MQQADGEQIALPYLDGVSDVKPLEMHSNAMHLIDKTPRFANCRQATDSCDY
jgi:hypothetical protein